MKESTLSLSEQENVFVQVLDDAESHDNWLVLVRYALPTLVANQRLLAEIICREAIVQCGRSGLTSHKPSDHIAEIFTELGLDIKLRVQATVGYDGK